MEKRTLKGKRGIVAMLDGLMAYTVAFVCIGIVSALITETQEADIKTDYALNVWAEDLADAIGMSMVNGTADQVGWKSNTTGTVLNYLNISLNNIHEQRGISMRVEVGGSLLLDEKGNMTLAEHVATADRLLINLNNPNRIVLLKVVVGL